MDFRGIKKRVILVILGIIAVALTGCSSEEATADPISVENYFLDTVCTITVYDMGGELDEEKANKAITDAYARCSDLDAMLTNKQDTSEVAAINNAGGEWVEVSDDTLNIIKAGIEYGKISDGAFDITIGRVTDLWDFHAEDPVVPDAKDVADAVKHVDYTKVEIDGNKVRLDDPEMKLDLGGIAKGYVGDQVAKLLVDEGVTSGIVNLGGNVVAIGEKAEGTPFVIGVEKPFSDRSELIGKVGANDETVVTSGIYERQFEVDGKLYHHVLNPKTGYPVDTDLEAVSLKAPRGKSMDCDAMSTICLIKGLEEGQKFINSIDYVEAVFCPEDGTLVPTDGMDFEAAN